MELSIIIPTYNSAIFIEKTIEEFILYLNDLDYEIIIINDGSKDNTHIVCTHLASKHNGIKYIELHKNVGEYNAVFCGLHHAFGKYIAIVDDDLQNKPKEVMKLYIKIETSKADVVYANYTNKAYPLWRKIMSNLFNIFALFLFLKPYKLKFNSFKIMQKKLAEEIIKYRGPFTFFDFFVPRLTDKIATQAVENYPSLRGKSNYNIFALIRICILNILGHSHVLYIFSIILFFVSLINSNWYFITYFCILLIGLQVAFVLYGKYFARYKLQFEEK